MTEKIGLIKNPLTIIAIFAGIAEVSGAVVLPFVKDPNQVLFIYFLILFPTILVILFFLTLNFNHKVLYAPSDFQNEDNFFRVSKFDSSKQEEIQITVSKNDEIKVLYEQINTLQNAFETKLQQVENRTASNSDNRTLTKLLYDYKVIQLPRSDQFISLMKSKGYNFEIHRRFENDETINIEEQKSIWLGRNIPLEIAKEVVINAKKFYPHLEYIKVSGDDSVPAYVYDQIFIGGATRSSLKIHKLLPLSQQDFKKINEINSLEELHNFINSFKSS
jgi:hypothetical protein